MNRRAALVIVLLLSIVVSLTTTGARVDEATPFGHPFKDVIHVVQPRASQVREADRRMGSGGDRVRITATWARFSPTPSFRFNTSHAHLTPRSASTFPPYWSSTHLTI